MRKFYVPGFILFVILLSHSAFGTTFIVTNTNDTGNGSLRFAISQANGDNSATQANPHIIDFNISGASPHTITPAFANGGYVIGNYITIMNTSGDQIIISGTVAASTLFDISGNGSGQIGLDNITFSGSTRSVVSISSTNPSTKNMITNCVFQNNTASAGAAIGFNGSSTLLVQNSSFVNNKSTLAAATAGGGAIASAGSISIINCSFNKNIAATASPSNFGDAINITGGTATITNCTIADNNGATAGSAGIYIRAGGTANIKNTIILGHQADIFANNNYTINYSIVTVKSGTGVATGSNNITTTNAAAVFGTASPVLSVNGGLTTTIALIAGSPAINAADLTGAPAKDQRDYIRPDAIDIGAYEYNAEPVTGNFMVTNVNDSGTGSLRQAVLDANLVTTATAAFPNTITFTPGLSGTIVSVTDITISSNVLINGSPGVTIERSTADHTILGTSTASISVSINNLNFNSSQGGTISRGISASNTSGQFIVDNCTFTNFMHKDGGAAIFTQAASGTLIVTNSTFTGNKSDLQGNCIRAGITPTTITVQNSTFMNNGFLGFNPPATYNVSSSVIRMTSGGAITNCTMINNDCKGIIGGNGTTIKNSILLNNKINGTVEDVNGTNYILDHCLYENLTGGTPAASSANYTTSTVVTVFGATPVLGNNGGVTATVPIISGSPAKDAGIATGAPVTDQRGYSRNGTVDIGAFEFGGVAPVLPKEINVKDASDNTITDGGNTVFGTFNLTGSATKIYTIENTGTSVLTLTGTPSLTGSAGFSIVNFPAANTTIAAGANTTFTIKFDPAGLSRGTKTGSISFGSDDADENPYNIDFTADIKSPEVNVQDAASTSLASGDTYAFAAIALNGNVTESLTLLNAGNVTLTLSSPSVSGTGFSLLSVPSAFPGTIASSGSSPVFIKFDGAGLARGSYPGTLTFITDDEDEPNYTITLSASVTSPEINIKDGAANMISGDNVIFTAIPLNGSTSKILTIENNGNKALNLSNPQFTGDAGFTIMGTLPATIAATANAPLTINFDGSSLIPGTYSGTLSFTTDDADENPYTIDLEITIQTPEINVTDALINPIADGGSIPFGTFALTSSPVSNIYTIKNSGTATLTLTGTPALTGSAGFSIVNFPAANTTIAAGANTTFTIKFDPAGLSRGTKTGSISFGSDDADENPYNIDFTADIKSPEVNVQDAASTSLASGDTYVFAAIALNGNVTESLTLLNAGNVALTLSNPSVSGTGFSLLSVPSAFPGTIASSGSSPVFIKFDGTGLARGSYPGTLTFSTDDEDEPNYTITLSASVTSPEINVKNGAVNVSSGAKVIFTAIPLNGSTSKMLTIENNGNKALNLSSPSFTGNAGFTITGTLPASIAANNNAPLAINFDGNALTPGTYSGTLTFTTDDADENPYTIDLEIAVQTSEINVTDALSANIPDGGTAIDLGIFSLNGSVTKTYTIENTGASPLTLTGVPGLSGSTGFSMMSFPAVNTAIAPGGNTTFSIQFNATGLARGTQTATFSFANDDADENPYNIDFTAEIQSPEVNVKDGTTGIASGGTVPFTAVALNASITKVLTLENTGNITLTLSNPIVSGAGFSLSTAPSAFPATMANGSAPFYLQFDGAGLARGNYSGTLVFTTDDEDEPTYTINVTALIESPEVNVKDAVTDVASGDKVMLTAVLLNGTTFKTFSIENNGNATLNLSNAQLNGDAGFSFVGTFPAAIAANGAAPFTVEFDGAGLVANTYTSVLTFDTDDADESSYVIDLEIAVASPEITVNDGATDVADNGEIDFGISETDTNAVKNITIQNAGVLPLTISSPVLTGAGYSLTGPPFPSTIDPGKSAAFAVTFTASTPGTYPGKITFNSNDPDESVYIIHFSITIVDTKSPVIVGLSPADNNTEISLLPSLVIKFSEDIVKGTGTIALLKYNDNTVVFTADVMNAAVSFQNDVLTLALPVALLLPNESYYVIIDPGAITDKAGNAFAGLTEKDQWNFSTERVTVMLPTLFTPNQDGKDDFFAVAINNINAIDVKIYDRTGNLVYSTSSITEATTTGWDGTKNGVNQPIGVYVWEISGSFTDGQPLIFSSGNKGLIRLLR